MSAARMLRTTEPGTMTSIGNNFSIPPNSDWNNKKRAVMKNGCREKYKQNPQLCKCLSDTWNKQIVEARVDRFWGVDVKLHSDEVRNKSWSGLNHLGQVLMEIRQELCV